MFSTTESDTIRSGIKTNGLVHITRITSSRESRTWRDNVHMHDTETELHLVKQGSTEITIYNRTFTVNAGDIIVINPGVMHMVKSEAPVYLYTIRISSPTENHPWLIIPKNISPVANSGEYFSFLLHNMESLSELAYHGMGNEACLCDIIGTAIVETYKKIYSSSTEEFYIPKMGIALDIIKYINDHYSQDISLTSIADALFVTPNYISNIFKTTFQVSPINYLINRRMCEAKWYLINTRESIKEISNIVGYDNYYYFEKLFLKRTGITPEEYRKKNHIIEL